MYNLNSINDSRYKLFEQLIAEIESLIQVNFDLQTAIYIYIFVRKKGNNINFKHQ